MRFNEVVEIPRRCRECPMLGRVATDYNNLEVRKVGLLDYSSENKQRAISEIAVHEDISLEEAEEFYVLHEIDFRTALLHEHDDIVQAQENEIGIAHKMLLLCQDGVLRMRAARNGTQVEVTVCMSDVIRMSSAITGFEIAKVSRKQLPSTTESKTPPPSDGTDNGGTT